MAALRFDFQAGSNPSPESEFELQFNNSELARRAKGDANISHAGKTFTFLEENHALLPTDLVYCRGSSQKAREDLLVDFQDPVLKQKFNQCFNYMKTTVGIDPEAPTQPASQLEDGDESMAVANFKADSEEALEALIIYVNSLFTRFESKEEMEKQFLEKVLKDKRQLVLSELLSKGDQNIGYCRHKVLIVAAFLMHMIENLSGKPYQESTNEIYRIRFRYEIKAKEKAGAATEVNGEKQEKKDVPPAHAVILFKSENNALYLLDTTNHLAVNLHQLTAEQRKQLNKKYYNTPFIESIQYFYDNTIKAAKVGPNP